MYYKRSRQAGLFQNPSIGAACALLGRGWWRWRWLTTLHTAHRHRLFNRWECAWDDGGDRAFSFLSPDKNVGFYILQYDLPRSRNISDGSGGGSAGYIRTLFTSQCVHTIYTTNCCMPSSRNDDSTKTLHCKEVNNKAKQYKRERERKGGGIGGMMSKTGRRRSDGRTLYKANNAKEWHRLKIQFASTARGICCTAHSIVYTGTVFHVCMCVNERILRRVRDGVRHFVPSRYSLRRVSLLLSLFTLLFYPFFLLLFTFFFISLL